MLNELKQEANRTATANGAAAWKSTMSCCLDLFATIGALREQEESEIQLRFSRAYAEDPETAMKILFFARDIRGGMGERRAFRAVLTWLAQQEPQSLRRNLGYVAEYGRWDDLLVLLGTPCEKEALDVIREQYRKDMEALETENAPVSLLGKWLPSVNASSEAAALLGKRVARALGLKDREYRKSLSALRARIRILENYLRTRDYTFDYAAQPSNAMLKYRKAFLRNDGQRYKEFLDQALTGKKVMHTDTLMPYDVVYRCLQDYISKPFSAPISLSEEERASLDATWKLLPDFTDGKNSLAVVDGSGSMYYNGSRTAAMPAAAAMAMGIYMAEHNHGAFHNHFITFSETPRLVEIKGRDIAEKVRMCMGYNEIANTNLQAVFALLLRTARKHSLPQEELPARIYIISDMEFDLAVDNADATIFQDAREKFEKAGYTLPEVVFWNVYNWGRQQPVQMNDQGVALVSGYSPRLFQQLAGNITDPYETMMEILSAERYAPIHA